MRRFLYALPGIAIDRGIPRSLSIVLDDFSTYFFQLVQVSAAVITALLDPLTTYHVRGLVFTYPACHAASCDPIQEHLL